MVKLADALAARKGDLVPPPTPPIRMVALDVKSVVGKQNNTAEVSILNFFLVIPLLFSVSVNR